MTNNFKNVKTFSGRNEDEYHDWALEFGAAITLDGAAAAKVIFTNDTVTAVDKQKVYAYLVLHTSHTARDIISEHDGDGRKAYKALKDKYNAEHPERAHALTEELMRRKWRPDSDTIASFREDVAIIRRKLKRAGEDKTDRQFRSAIARLLPPILKFPVDLQLNDPDGTVDNLFDAIETYSLQNDIIFPTPKQTASGDSTNTAMFVGRYSEDDERETVRTGGYGRGRGRGRRGNGQGRGRGRDAHIQCDRCDKFGHRARHCPDNPHRAGKQAEATAMTAVRHNIAALTLQQGNECNAFIIDSGASQHIVNNRDLFLDDYVDLPADDEPIWLAGKEAAIQPAGQGTVRIPILDDNGNDGYIDLSNCIYAPEAAVNMLSTLQLLDDLPYVTSSPAMTHSRTTTKLHLGDGRTITRPHGRNKVVWLIPRRETKTAMATTSGAVTDQAAPSTSLRLWHERLGHISKARCQQAAAQNDPPVQLIDDLESCETCHLTKSNRQPVSHLPAHLEKRVTPGELLFMDFTGQIEHRGLRGELYALVIIDAATRWIEVMFTATKSNAPDLITQFVTEQRGARPQASLPITSTTTLNTDGDPVFTSQAFLQACADMHIQTRRSPPHTQAANGMAESALTLLWNLARPMLHNAACNKSFWPLALKHAAYLHNITPTRALGNRSPFLALTGSPPPQLSLIKRFGAPAYIHVPQDQRARLENKAERGTYVGYSSQSQAHLVLIGTTTRVTHHVTVDETLTVKAAKAREDGAPVREDELQPQQAPQDGVAQADKRPRRAAAAVPVQYFGKDSEHITMAAGHFVQEEAEGTSNEQDATTPEEEEHARGDDITTPRNLKEALRGRHAEEWQGAIEAEKAALQANDTYDIIPITDMPADEQLLRSFYVFKAKHNAQGEFIKCKARLTVLGNMEHKDDTRLMAPTISATGTRVFLAVAAARNNCIEAFDCFSAYTQAELPTPKYMRPPDNEQQWDEHGNQLVYRLRKSLYGLRVAGRLWNEHITHHLLRTGFRQSANDPCLFTLLDGADLITLILYVDDALYAFPEHARKRIDKFKLDLAAELKVTFFGDAQEFLGMTIKRLADGISISQAAKLRLIVDEAGLTNAYAAKSPMASGVSNDMDSQQLDEVRKQRYQRIVGQLTHIASYTRPDLAYSVSILGSHAHAPTRAHQAHLKHVLRYIKGSLDRGLHLGGNKRPVLSALADSDYAADKQTRRSRLGYIINFNGSVDWKSQLNDKISLSTTEAEMTAACAASKQIVYLRRVLEDYQFPQEPTVVEVDNQAAIVMLRDSRSSFKLRHVDVALKFTQELVTNGTTRYEYVHTSRNTADVLTKALPLPRFTTHCNTLFEGRE